MKQSFFLFCLLTSFLNLAQSGEANDKEAILNILKIQEETWSNNNLEGFMQDYWKSDSLKFYGAGGLTYGWDKTLANYKKRYPTKEHSGKLTFTINDISKINEGSYFVMGAYYLKRTIGDTDGVFMIILKKIDGKWKIIADTSCQNFRSG